MTNAERTERVGARSKLTLGAPRRCGKRWPTIPKARRRVWGRLRKHCRRYGPEAGVHFDARWWRIWDRLKRAAIEAAAGIS
ncbi:hypothetical protein AC628_18100 [Bradyrhizobium sp. NAS96.2]|nr:hypothetical protein AC628_18100 [Bradyrhizobium sp. NAS96.2]